MSQSNQDRHEHQQRYETPLPPDTTFAHGVGFEEADANPRIAIVSIAIIAGLVLFVLILVVFIQRGFQNFIHPPAPLSQIPQTRVLPNGPRLEAHPWETLPKLRAREEQILNGYGRDAEGHIHIPIANAIDKVVPQLPIRADAPEGITTPGGQGRDFAGSIYDMPAGYDKPRPSIQGEIEGHAKK